MSLYPKVGFESWPDLFFSIKLFKTFPIKIGLTFVCLLIFCRLSCHIVDFFLRPTVFVVNAIVCDVFLQFIRLKALNLYIFFFVVVFVLLKSLFGIKVC